MAKLSGVLWSMNFSQTSAMVVAYWDMLSGIVQRGVGRGTKKPFGPELCVWPSRWRGMEDSRSRNLKSSGSWGQKSEGKSIMPGKLSWSSGSDLRSERARKSDEEPGDGSFSPAKSI